jgi:hypothetical protein
MTDDPANKKIIALAPRPDVFVTRLRELASDTGNIKWSQHARERMETRDIPMRVALVVIREGMIDGAIEPGSNPGEWKGKVVRNVKGRRDVGVVVLVVRNNFILVKTVEWEDLK